MPCLVVAVHSPLHEVNPNLKKYGLVNMKSTDSLMTLFQIKIV